MEVAPAAVPKVRLTVLEVVSVKSPLCGAGPGPGSGSIVWVNVTGQLMIFPLAGSSKRTTPVSPAVTALPL